MSSDCIIEFEKCSGAFVPHQSRSSGPRQLSDKLQQLCKICIVAPKPQKVTTHSSGNVAQLSVGERPVLCRFFIGRLWPKMTWFVKVLSTFCSGSTIVMLRYLKSNPPCHLPCNVFIVRDLFEQKLSLCRQKKVSDNTCFYLRITLKPIRY